MQPNCLNYPIETTVGVFDESNETLVRMLKADGRTDGVRVLIVADHNVVQHTADIGPRIGRYMRTHGLQLAGNPIVIGGGEKIKSDNLQTAMRTAAAMLSARLSRRDFVVIIGGGTVLDVAGYAAAQVRGGVRTIRIPTTPTAMIEAAFADYAAVDSLNVKDALRIPSTPAGVIIDTAFGATVLDGVWRGGYAPAVRIALACDASLLQLLADKAAAFQKRDMSTLEEIVAACLKIRRERTIPAIGLWGAYRMEAMSGYKLPHGYAIAIGVMIDCCYAQTKGWITAEERESVMSVLRNCGALDGAVHSRHLLSQTEAVVLGMDAWMLTTGENRMEFPVKLGEAAFVDNPDRAAMKSALNLIK